jgi:hypothetical protein
MTHLNAVRSTLCIAALFCGGAATADVTAQQVWDQWKAQMDIYGENGVTFGSEVMSGDTLTVSDLAMNMSNAESTVEASFGTLTLTENGDGTVSIVFPEEYPITIGQTGDMDNNQAVILVKMAGLKTVVSGTPEEMKYAFTADRNTITLNKVIEDGAELPVEMNFTISNISGDYMVKTADMRNVSYDMTAGSFDILVDVKDAENAFMLSGQMANLGMKADVDMPLVIDQEHPETMFADGFDVAGNYSIGKSALIFNVTESGQATNGAMGFDGGTLDFAMNADGMKYDSTTQNLSVSLSGGEIPFPVDFTLGEYGLGFEMPLAKSDEPVPFTAKVNLTDLAVNDIIWSMIDAGGVLPHDPATAQMDVSGTTTLFFDILDPTQTEAMEMADAPGELNSIALNNLKLAIAGALVTGTGNFTFDNTDMVSFDGMPRPEGEVNLQINGANGLMDKLIQMGLLPEDQAMGARMMMGMFATVVGDDQLTSRIEINAAGEVMANGQRIK